ncbi:TRAP transporter small permease subunit [Limnochorda pilosa]|uniref:Tripartite ATP-independent periplasmic transporters DctQ component domain-containing protein n=1 Tax=Limnochorda pilosa TaxID=1555112 RepID=A0A0K2SNL4_LIMPI|nr:TRAP transporter small permease subunit [Limnochorda pilosa]BAS28695.1 hypothetical protein LIP_2866 [Limnochorda pilosa]
MAGLSIYEVVMRRFLGRPTIWTLEVTGYVLAANVMLALGYTLFHKEHVNVDFITERVSGRARAILEIVTILLFLGPLLYVLLTQGYAYAQRSWAVLERAPSAFNSPVYLAKTLVPLGAGLLALQAFGEILRNAVLLAKGRR